MKYNVTNRFNINKTKGVIDKEITNIDISRDSIRTKEMLAINIPRVALSYLILVTKNKGKQIKKEIVTNESIPNKYKASNRDNRYRIILMLMEPLNPSLVHEVSIPYFLSVSISKLLSRI